eukprot:2989322-Prorocentrum_lima.AAC.1
MTGRVSSSMAWDPRHTTTPSNTHSEQPLGAELRVDSQDVPSHSPNTQQLSLNEAISANVA